MTLKTINICPCGNANDISFALNGDEFDKLAVYSQLEHMSPEVFLRKAILAGIKSYEALGVI